MTLVIGAGEPAKIDPRELNRILTEHERFVLGRGGMRAQLKGARLDGAVLANRKLNESDFSGASLVGASFYGSSLVRASFYCSDLRNCSLRNSTLTHADMRGASFKGADLGFAILDYADLRAATMMLVQEKGVSLIDHGTKGSGFGGVDFSNASLRNTSFAKAKLEGANFNGAILVGTSFRGAKLSDATFTGAVLMGVNIVELDLPREVFADCVFDPGPEQHAKIEILKAKVAGHMQWVASNGEAGAAAHLDGEDLRVVGDQFRGRSLVGLSACGAVGIGVDFSSCQLQGAKFDGADLRGASFNGADLSGASFHCAKLAHGRFDHARLGNLQLRSGEILMPNLSGAEVTPDQIKRAILDESLAALGIGGSASAELRL